LLNEVLKLAINFLKNNNSNNSPKKSFQFSH
jgi:hypothetical protein